MTLVRRRLIYLAAATVGAGMLPRSVWAQSSYPTRPVRVIVPFTAGGPATVIGRIIVQKLSESMGQNFYIDNIPAGASNVGTAAAAKAPPDGHTILIITNSFVINTSLYAKLAYDPIRDFTPVSLVAFAPHVLSINPSLPATNVKEFVALVKANPGKYSYASAGAGQAGHLAAELFKLSLGLDLVHVPFNGAAPAMTATIGGHTPVIFSALPSAATFIKDGQLRALAVTSAKRSPEFPDIPTLAEAGIPDQESIFFQGVVAPAGTPKEIVDRLNREIKRILALPDVEKLLAKIGFTVAPNSPEEFAIQIKAEIAKWAKVIRAANIAKIE